MGFCLTNSSPGRAADASTTRPSLQSIAIRSSQVPLSFEPNLGQSNSQVKYLARGEGYTLFLTPTSTVLGLRDGSSGAATNWVRLQLQGAASMPAMAGEEKLPGVSNYLRGNKPSLWQTNIPNYARVRYKEVYPGVDLIYYGRQGQLEN